MGDVAAWELRRDTARVLRRVERGERVTITDRGRPVAALVPIQKRQRRPLPVAELMQRLEMMRADPGLRDDLARLAGETTDDLDPIR